MLRVGLKIRLVKQFFIILLVITFTHTTTASAMTLPKDAEIDNARAEIAQSKKELATAQDVLKRPLKNSIRQLLRIRKSELNWKKPKGKENRPLPKLMH